jgi:hypothetical protein
MDSAGDRIDQRRQRRAEGGQKLVDAGDPHQWQNRRIMSRSPQVGARRRQGAGLLGPLPVGQLVASEHDPERGDDLSGRLRDSRQRGQAHAQASRFVFFPLLD